MGAAALATFLTTFVAGLEALPPLVNLENILIKLRKM